MGDIQLPPGVRNEPLLAGVEDNPVYRLLVRTQKRKRRNVFRADHDFPFSHTEWDDLDMLPIGPRDFAQAIWAHRSNPAGFGRGKRLSRVIFSIVGMGTVGALIVSVHGVFLILAIPFIIDLWLAGDSWGNSENLTPTLIELTSQFSFVLPMNISRSVIHVTGVIVLILSLIFAYFWMMAIVFHDSIKSPIIPLASIGYGFCCLIIGRFYSELKTFMLRDRKNTYYQILVDQMDSLMKTRRENEHAQDE